MVQPQNEPVDPNVRIADQLKVDAGPVVLLNTFVFAPEDMEAALEFYARAAAVMKRQPGCISTQLHRAIGGANVAVNYAVWESVAHFRAAIENPEFIAARAMAPASAVASPVLLQKVAVPGICGA